jgi:hypothetical protein
MMNCIVMIGGVGARAMVFLRGSENWSQILFIIDPDLKNILSESNLALCRLLKKELLLLIGMHQIVKG